MSAEQKRFLNLKNEEIKNTYKNINTIKFNKTKCYIGPILVPGNTDPPLRLTAICSGQMNASLNHWPSPVQLPAKHPLRALNFRAHKYIDSAAEYTEL